MKEIKAIIKPFKLEEVRDSLREAGVTGMTVYEVKGFGRTGGKTEVFRGSAYTVDFVPKIKIEMVVPDAIVAQVVARLAAAAKTDKIGDGKIFVTTSTRPSAFAPASAATTRFRFLSRPAGSSRISRALLKSPGKARAFADEHTTGGSS